MESKSNKPHPLPTVPATKPGTPPYEDEDLERLDSEIKKKRNEIPYYEKKRSRKGKRWVM